MARVLLGSLSVLGWGCLVPQDDTLLPAEPIYRNHAPFFVNSSPASAYIRTDNCDGTSLEFRVNVADPDLDDFVRVRYYVDFPEINQGFEVEALVSNTGAEVRPETVVYAPIVNSAGSALTEARLHTVEAVVFDGTLSPTRTPEPRAVIPDGGVNPSYLAIVRWVVETEACP